MPLAGRGPAARAGDVALVGVGVRLGRARAGAGGVGGVAEGAKRLGRKVFVSSDMSVDERVQEVAEASPLAALAWPWLLTAFDDWGRMEASAARLKLAVFPGIEQVTRTVVEEALTLYDAVGLITLYEVEGKRYACIQPDKWFRYQTHIHASKREADRSKHPAPPADALPRGDARKCALPREDARRARVLTPSPSPSPDPPCLRDVRHHSDIPPGGGGCAAAVTEATGHATPPAQTAAGDGVEAIAVTAAPQPSGPPKPTLNRKQQALFAEFWQAFPKRKNKGQAEKAWAKLQADQELLEVMLDALARARDTPEWRKDGGQYIPYPATWLNARGWEDEHGREQNEALVHGPGYVDFDQVAEHWERQMREVAGKRGT